MLSFFKNCCDSSVSLNKTLMKISIIEMSLGLPNYFFLPPFFSFLSSHLSLAIPTLSFLISLLLHLSMRSRLIHVLSFTYYRLESAIEPWTHASPIFLLEKKWPYYLGTYFNPPENPFEAWIQCLFHGGKNMRNELLSIPTVRAGGRESLPEQNTVLAEVMEAWWLWEPRKSQELRRGWQILEAFVTINNSVFMGFLSMWCIYIYFLCHAFSWSLFLWLVLSYSYPLVLCYH